MLGRKLHSGTTAMGTSELADEIRQRELYFQKEGGFADASQVGAHANQYPALFSTETTGGERMLTLKELPRLSATL